MHKCLCWQRAERGSQGCSGIHRLPAWLWDADTHSPARHALWKCSSPDCRQHTNHSLTQRATQVHTKTSKDRGCGESSPLQRLLAMDVCSKVWQQCFGVLTVLLAAGTQSTKGGRGAVLLSSWATRTLRVPVQLPFIPDRVH